VKDEKYKPASKRQYKRLAQLVRLTGKPAHSTVLRPSLPGQWKEPATTGL